MKANKDRPGHPELEQAFFNDGYRLAAEHLSGEVSQLALLHAVHHLYETLESFLDLFLENAQKGGVPAQCKKGCSWCCHQAVFAQDHEIRYLKDRMFRNFTEEQLDHVRRRAGEKQGNTASLSPAERLLHKEACPLLQNNACMAYEARPVACRIYLSSDLESCRHEYRDPRDKSNFPQLFEVPLLAGRKFNEGFTRRLKECGQSTAEYPLEQGLLG